MEFISIFSWFFLNFENNLFSSTYKIFIYGLVFLVETPVKTQIWRQWSRGPQRFGEDMNINKLEVPLKNVTHNLEVFPDVYLWLESKEKIVVSLLDTFSININAKFLHPQTMVQSRNFCLCFMIEFGNSFIHASIA